MEEFEKEKVPNSKDLPADAVQDAIIEYDEENNKELVKAMMILPKFQQDFVYKYFQTQDPKGSYMFAEKQSGKSTITKPAEREHRAKRMLMRSDVNQAIKELRKQSANQFQLAVASIGEKTVKAFGEIAERKDTLKMINDELVDIELLISTMKLAGDTKGYVMLLREKRSMIKLKNDVEDSIDKAVKTVNDIAGNNKEKTVVRAGSLTINVGAPEMKNVGEIIDDDVVVEELPEL